MAMVTTYSGQAPMYILCDGLSLGGGLVLRHILYCVNELYRPKFSTIFFSLEKFSELFPKG